LPQKIPLPLKAKSKEDETLGADESDNDIITMPVVRVELTETKSTKKKGFST
jgi:hypothetical protein